MSIVIDGTTGISSIGTLTGVTSISSASADTPVILGDSGTNYNTCRAWVNFNGTGTVAIRADFNVTSITDNGTGDYTVNFTTAMPDVNYAFTQHITCSSSGSINDGCDLQSIATGSFRVLCGSGGTALDADYAMFSVFR
jgi:hypothetical protein